MKPSIKVIHTSNVRTSKTGNKYRKILTVVKIGTQEYLRTFYSFE